MYDSEEDSDSCLKEDGKSSSPTPTSPLGGSNYSGVTAVDSKEWRIRVKTMKHGDFWVSVAAESTVEVLVKKIAASKKDISIEIQRIIWKGKIIRSGNLRELGLSNGCAIHLISSRTIKGSKPPSTARQGRPLCHNGHSMVISDYSEGGYATGWVCDRCTRTGFGRRWLCLVCHCDYCQICEGPGPGETDINAHMTMLPHRTPIPSRLPNAVPPAAAPAGGGRGGFYPSQQQQQQRQSVSPSLPTTTTSTTGGGTPGNNNTRNNGNNVGGGGWNSSSTTSSSEGKEQRRLMQQQQQQLETKRAMEALAPVWSLTAQAHYQLGRQIAAALTNHPNSSTSSSSTNNSSSSNNNRRRLSRLISPEEAKAMSELAYFLSQPDRKEPIPISHDLEGLAKLCRVLHDILRGRDLWRLLPLHDIAKKLEALQNEHRSAEAANRGGEAAAVAAAAAAAAANNHSSSGSSSSSSSSSASQLDSKREPDFGLPTRPEVAVEVGESLCRLGNAVYVLGRLLRRNFRDAPSPSPHPHAKLRQQQSTRFYSHQHHQQQQRSGRQHHRDESKMMRAPSSSSSSSSSSSLSSPLSYLSSAVGSILSYAGLSTNTRGNEVDGRRGTSSGGEAEGTRNDYDEKDDDYIVRAERIESPDQPPIHRRSTATINRQIIQRNPDGSVRIRQVLRFPVHQSQPPFPNGNHSNVEEGTHPPPPARNQNVSLDRRSPNVHMPNMPPPPTSIAGALLFSPTYHTPTSTNSTSMRSSSSRQRSNRADDSKTRNYRNSTRKRPE